MHDPTVREVYRTDGLGVAARYALLLFVKWLTRG